MFHPWFPGPKLQHTMKWRTQAACWTRPPSFRRTRAQFWLLHLFLPSGESPRHYQSPIYSLTHHMNWRFHPMVADFPPKSSDLGIIFLLRLQEERERRARRRRLEEEPGWAAGAGVGAGVESTWIIPQRQCIPFEIRFLSTDFFLSSISYNI